VVKAIVQDAYGETGVLRLEDVVVPEIWWRSGRPGWIAAPGT
jgi:hypothetical protein